MSHSSPRPVYLNLFQFRFPVMAIASVLHRFSGICMVLAIPGVLYLFEQSLSSEQGYQKVADILASPFVLLFVALLIWSLVHHFFAGLRCLLIDLDIGAERNVARFTAWSVNIGAALVTFVLLLVLWL